MDVSDPKPKTDDLTGQLLSKYQRRSRLQILYVVLLLLVVLLCLWFTGLLDTARMSQGIPAIGVLISEMIPPDFSRWRAWLKPLVDTLAMSIAGTALAVVISLPIAFVATAKTGHHSVRWLARMILNLMRAIPELIMGIVFVAAVGFGMLSGVLALGLHSVGMVGKFFAEAIEHAHPAPIEAVESTGATPLQVITHGVIPQVLPRFADVTMYRWEYNFRASTVMGMVGAGGIGTDLIGSLRLLDYAQVGALLIVILIAVTIVDGLSHLLRRQLT